MCKEFLKPVAMSRVNACGLNFRWFREISLYLPEH